MGEAIELYSFRDDTFGPAGDTHVCIVNIRDLKPYLSKGEVDAAFSGYVIFKSGFFTRFIGVWGRRNGKRLRRFIVERGATINLNRARPDGIRLASFWTGNERKRVRQLADLDASSDRSGQTG